MSQPITETLTDDVTEPGETNRYRVAKTVETR